LVLPSDSPCTTPSAETDAITGFELLHVTGLPWTGSPRSSRASTEKTCSAPTRSDALFGVTATDATGTGLTEMMPVPATPCTVAVTKPEPGATAVTTPAAETVAISVATDQATASPDIALPDPSRAMALKAWVRPTINSTRSGTTATDVTTAGSSGSVKRSFPTAQPTRLRPTPSATARITLPSMP
jgi:hypothetical protein